MRKMHLIKQVITDYGQTKCMRWGHLIGDRQLRTPGGLMFDVTDEATLVTCGGCLHNMRQGAFKSEGREW